MLLIISKVAVVFAMVGIGLGANKLNILPSESNKYLIALLLNIASPCLLITSIAGKELTDETSGITLMTLAGSLITYFVMLLLAYGMTRLLRAPKMDRGVYVSIITTLNNGFMGFPIAQASFGDDALYLMVLCNVVMCVMIYTVGFVQVHIGGDGFDPAALKRNAKSMINPNSVSAFIGMFLLFAEIKLPDFLFSLMEQVGDISIPLSMIVVGVQLGESQLGKVITNRKLVAAAAFKQFVIPVISFLVFAWLPLPDMVRLVLILSTCFPMAVNMVAVTSLENRNATLASEGVAITTVLSMITLPVAIVVLTAYFGI